MIGDLYELCKMVFTSRAEPDVETPSRLLEPVRTQEDVVAYLCRANDQKSVDIVELQRQVRDLRLEVERLGAAQRNNTNQEGIVARDYSNSTQEIFRPARELTVRQRLGIPDEDVNTIAVTRTRSGRIQVEDISRVTTPADPIARTRQEDSERNLEPGL